MRQRRGFIITKSIGAFNTKSAFTPICTTPTIKNEIPIVAKVEVVMAGVVFKDIRLRIFSHNTPNMKRFSSDIVQGRTKAK